MSNGTQQGNETFFQRQTSSTWRGPPPNAESDRQGVGKKKYVIQMSGPPGAGKSTLARNLSAEMRQAGLAAVVINHDLIKTFFLRPSYPEGCVGQEEAAASPELGLSFTDAGKMAYKMDWVLAADYFHQGQDVVIVDSVCNYREAIEHGLNMVKRWNSYPCSAGSGNNVCPCKDCDPGSEMRYVYVECRFEGDLWDLDQRLKERARQQCKLKSQRGGVYEAPTGEGKSQAEITEEKARVARELFKKWMNPARPTARDDATVVVVDSKNNSSDECARVVLKELGL